jgi:DNA-binding transcriptional regulator of glucitol operon
VPVPDRSPKREEKESDNEMKMKMTAIFAILMIALMTSGIAYACWLKYIHINGYVKTGKLDAVFQNYGISWNATDAGGVLVPANKLTGITVEAYPDYDEDITGETFKVNITGLYPCITIHVYFNITNTGTVPWIVNSTSMDATGFPGTVVLSGPTIGTQVDPNGELAANIDVHITNDAIEETDYGFTFHILVVQWNEYPYIP